MRRRHLLTLLPAVSLAAAAIAPARTTRAATRSAADRSVAADDLDLRVMVWNVRSATLAGIDPEMPAEVGLENRAQLIEFLRERDPDVLFMIETYGSGEAILAGLNNDRPAERHYTGVQITEGRNDPSEHRDNLWLFTRLEVVEKFPTINEEVTSSFNFGGVRAALPNGDTICLFTTWLWHEGWAWGLTDDSVWDETHGLPRRHTDADIVATDTGQRTEMATTILQDRIPSFVRPGEQVIMGGDFNTLTHLDWTAEFADAPGHAGLVLDWPVLRQYADAGFTDIFRTVHPNAGRYPGTTWSPVYGTGVAPGRIDYLLSHGDEITPLAARSDLRRLERHRSDQPQEFSRDAQFPFYSDHGSVTADLRVAGGGHRPWGSLPPLPVEAPTPEPAEPQGRRIAGEEITASASSELDDHPAEAAIDDDPTSLWHSAESSNGTFPQTLRLDLGKARGLTALRYVPRQRYNGIISRYEVRTSIDGTRFRTRARGERGHTSVPTVVPLRGRARYVELVAHHGYAGFASAAEVELYEG